MIDKITIKTVSDYGREWDEIRIWICGISFRADANAYHERLIKRIAVQHGIDLIDTRNIR